MHASAPAILASRLVVHWLSTYLCLFAQQGRAQDAGHGAEHFCYVYVDLEYFCGAYMDLEHFCAAHVCVCACVVRMFALSVCMVASTFA